MRSMKGVMNSSFRKSLITNTTYIKKSVEMQCLNKFLQVGAKSLIKAFPNLLY